MHLLRQKILKSVFTAVFVAFVTVSSFAQVMKTVERTFEVSKLGTPNAVETKEKMQELFALIKERDFINDKEQIVSILSTAGREYYVDKVLRRISPTEFLIETSPRYADGTKMASFTRRYVLSTLVSRNWSGLDRPELKIFATEGSSVNYVDMDGTKKITTKLTEVTLEQLGLTEMSEEVFKEFLQNGREFRISETSLGTDKKPIRTLWTIKQ